MKQLTLENIAWYLPWRTIGISQSGRMYYLDTYSNMRGSGIENREIGAFISDQILPVLLPMSDLTKPFIKDGQEVIPIVELAKISDNYYPWVLLGNEAVAGGFSNRIIFRYDFKDGSFVSGDSEGPMHVRNQLALFKWLYTNKFDVAGLISDGLAIDANTLETNPYL